MLERKLPAAWRTLRRADRRRKAATVRVRSLVRNQQTLAPTESARVAGLRYVNDARMPGIRRVGSKDRVRYVGPDGRTISDRAELQRIKSLAIPPAWTDVWICPDARGHVQATGARRPGAKTISLPPAVA